jgi:hypothetical protein
MATALNAGQGPGMTQSEWHDYERLDFVVDGHQRERPLRVTGGDADL